MANKADPIKTAASRIRNAMKNGKPCKPVRDLIKKGNLDAAYAIQQTNTDIWIEEGRRPVGRKIGLTAKSVQTQLGVDQPDYGILYADMEGGGWRRDRCRTAHAGQGRGRDRAGARQ